MLLEAVYMEMNDAQFFSHFLISSYLRTHLNSRECAEYIFLPYLLSSSVQSSEGGMMVPNTQAGKLKTKTSRG